VREASFVALGTAMKVVGEKVLGAFMGEIDPIKMTKVRTQVVGISSHYLKSCADAAGSSDSGMISDVSHP